MMSYSAALVPAHIFSFASSLLFLLPQHLPPLHDHGMQLLQTLLQTLTDDRTRWLKVPGCRRAELTQSQHALHLRQCQRVSQVLLVCHHQHRHTLVLCEPCDLMQLCFGFLNSLGVNRVHHKHNAVSTAGVRAPQGPQLLLTSYIPKVEGSCPPAASKRHFNLLCVKTFSGNSVHKLIEAQSVQHSGLSCTIQTQDDDVERLEGWQAGEVRV